MKLPKNVKSRFTDNVDVQEMMSDNIIIYR